MSASCAELVSATVPPSAATLGFAPRLSSIGQMFTAAETLKSPVGTAQLQICTITVDMLLVTSNKAEPSQVVTPSLAVAITSIS